MTGSNADSWLGHLTIEVAWLSKGHWSGHSGGVDEVRIDERALSAEESAAHAAGEFSDDTGLLAHWSFDDSGDLDDRQWFETHHGTRFYPTTAVALIELLPVFITR